MIHPQISGATMAKKQYSATRDLVAVCPKCRVVTQECSCGFIAETHHNAWVFVTPDELEHFKQTGLVPDYQAELMRSNEDTSPTKMKPLQYPPVYDFKV